MDTNVLVGAMIRGGGPNRMVIRACLTGTLEPILGQALYLEYEDVMNRSVLFATSALTARDRGILLDAFLSVCEWTPVYYSWRPNLRDEGDNHVFELAVAGSATIVTNNLADFRSAEMEFPSVRVLTPGQVLEVLQ